MATSHTFPTASSACFLLSKCYPVEIRKTIDNHSGVDHIRRHRKIPSNSQSPVIDIDLDPKIIQAHITLLRLDTLSLYAPQPIWRIANSGAPMILHCPSCKSVRIAASHTGRKVCTSVGTVAGAASAFSAASSGARIGAIAGAFAGPGGVVAGSIAGAIVSGVVGAIAGGTAGAALGDFLDENVLDKFQCLECGHAFSVDTD